MLSLRASSLAFAAFAALAALAAFVALVLATPAGATTTLINENFESGSAGVLTPSGQVGVLTGQDYVNCCSATGSAGARSNHFASFGTGDLASGTLTSPVISTIGGETYTLTFNYGSWGQGSETIFIDFLFDGFPITNSFVTAGTTDLDAVFSPAIFVISPAVNGTMSFSFRTSGGRGIDGFIDNVLLVTTATLGVPEPSSWAMMLLGFAGIGFVVRRQRRAAALA